MWHETSSNQVSVETSEVSRTNFNEWCTWWTHGKTTKQLRQHSCRWLATILSNNCIVLKNCSLDVSCLVHVVRLVRSSHLCNVRKDSCVGDGSIRSCCHTSQQWIIINKEWPASSGHSCCFVECFHVWINVLNTCQRWNSSSNVGC